MDRAKRDRLKEAGWRVGSTAEFLGLSDEESDFVEMKRCHAEGYRVCHRTQER